MSRIKRDYTKPLFETRTRISVSSDDPPEKVAEAMAQIGTASEELEKTLTEYEAACNERLREAGLPEWPDCLDWLKKLDEYSPTWFAIKNLVDVQILRSHVASGDAVQTAVAALRLGLRAGDADIASFTEAIRRGSSQIRRIPQSKEDGKKGGRPPAINSRTQKKLRAQAEEIWKTNRAISVDAMALKLKQKNRLHATTRTIGKAIEDLEPT